MLAPIRFAYKGGLVRCDLSSLVCICCCGMLPPCRAANICGDEQVNICGDDLVVLMVAGFDDPCVFLCLL